MVVEGVGTLTEWDRCVLAAQDAPHFMQGAAWAVFKDGGPWAVDRFIVPLARGELAVQRFAREAAGYGVLQHVPRISGIGPGDVARLTAALRDGADEAFAVKIEVHRERDPGLERAFERAGWLPARASQYRHAIHVVLSDGAEQALLRMKKRARQEIRRAERSGVVCAEAAVDDAGIAEMLMLVQATAERTDAFFREREYLEGVWRTFAEFGQGRLFLARHEGVVLAGAFVVTYGDRAWFKDGGSRRGRPDLFASRLLQWEIIRTLAKEGIGRYDLGSIPDPAVTPPGTNGILTFKSAFAQGTVEYPPAYELGFAPVAERWRAQEGNHLRAYNAVARDYWY